MKKKIIKPPQRKPSLKRKSNKATEGPSSTSHQSFSTQFYGQVQGPLVTGSGDLIIKNLSYDTDDKELSLRLTALYSELEQSVRDSTLSIISTLADRLQKDTADIIEQLNEHSINSEEVEDLISLVKNIINTPPYSRLLESKANKHNALEFHKAIESPNLSVSHKLKITIPIIPLLLGYEGEMDVGSKLDLEKAWLLLRSRFLLSS